MNESTKQEIFLKILRFYILFPPDLHEMTLFHQNYRFNIFNNHQTIDLVKKICWKLLSSDLFNQIYSLMLVIDIKTVILMKKGKQHEAQEEEEYKI
jgi:hypothetical protein